LNATVASIEHSFARAQAATMIGLLPGERHSEVTGRDVGTSASGSRRDDVVTTPQRRDVAS
jgi:hypothetical protein